MYPSTDESLPLCRPPERLVIAGYRSWMTRGEIGPAASWERAWLLHQRLVGSEAAGRVIFALLHFVKALEGCATCPLRSQPFEAERITREEGLILSLIASIQHGDEATMEAALRRLTCINRCAELAIAAGHYALALKAAGHVLVPAPVGSQAPAAAGEAPDASLAFGAASPTRH